MFVLAYRRWAAAVAIGVALGVFIALSLHTPTDGLTDPHAAKGWASRYWLAFSALVIFATAVVVWLVGWHAVWLIGAATFATTEASIRWFWEPLPSWATGMDYIEYAPRGGEVATVLILLPFAGLLAGLRNAVLASRERHAGRAAATR